MKERLSIQIPTSLDTETLVDDHELNYQIVKTIRNLAHLTHYDSSLL